MSRWVLVRMKRQLCKSRVQIIRTSVSISDLSVCKPSYKWASGLGTRNFLRNILLVHGYNRYYLTLRTTVTL
jgi:hypothetical protein